MKVLVATSLVPFGSDPERELSEELAGRLRRRGHRVEFLRLPRSAAGGELADLVVARTLELSNTDHLVALSFPACLLRHPRKTLWFTSALADKHSGNAAARAASQSVDESLVSFATTAGIAGALAGSVGRGIPVLEVPSGRWGAALDRLIP